MISNGHKQFLYLVQGQADLVREYHHLKQRKNADVIFLTYDKPLEDAIFFPNSTWAEGRNQQLSEALNRGSYEYYIYCDDDISFESGSWTQFENNLLRFKPGIAVPIFPKTVNSALKFPHLQVQPFFINDEQLIAFHREVVNDRIVVPYQTRFDQMNWWVSCEIQQLLIQNFYYFDAWQFNEIRIENTCKKRYTGQFEHSASFRDTVNEWLQTEFKGSYRVTSHYMPLRLHRLLSRHVFGKLKRSWSRCHSVPAGIPEKLLEETSVILKQHQDNNRL